MERNKYLILCQKASCLNDGACRIKQNIPDELTVVYEGIKYYPLGYKIEFKTGKPIHTAILHDLEVNTVVDCRLDDVEGLECENSGN